MTRALNQGPTSLNAAAMQRLYGNVYIDSPRGFCFPVTHQLNGVNGRTWGFIAASADGSFVNWRMVDAEGMVVIHSYERNHSMTRVGLNRCYRAALLFFRAYGARRVRP